MWNFCNNHDNWRLQSMTGRLESEKGRKWSVLVENELFHKTAIICKGVFLHDLKLFLLPKIKPIL